MAPENQSKLIGSLEDFKGFLCQHDATHSKECIVGCMGGLSPGRQWVHRRVKPKM